MSTLMRALLTPSLVLAMVVGGGIVAAGQAGDASPAAGGRPGYLQRGTCEQPGDPVAALAMTTNGPATATSPRSTPTATGGAPISAAVSVTELDMTLDALLDSELVVRVAESEAEPDRDIACGAIGGQPDDDGNVYLVLAQRDDSRVTGVVWLQANDDGTTVTLFLIPIEPPTQARL
jgi:hypothetical protein